MLTLIYIVEPEQANAEVEWLKQIRVYPAHEIRYDWKLEKVVARFATIVSDDTALLIKLRHPLQFQGMYKPR